MDARKRAGVARIHVFTSAEVVHGKFTCSEHWSRSFAPRFRTGPPIGRGIANPARHQDWPRRRLAAQPVGGPGSLEKARLKGSKKTIWPLPTRHQIISTSHSRSR